MHLNHLQWYFFRFLSIFKLLFLNKLILGIDIIFLSALSYKINYPSELAADFAFALSLCIFSRQLANWPFGWISINFVTPKSPGHQ